LLKVLRRGFYARRSALVAGELLGKIIVREFPGKKITARIVETEAYLGKNDPASHAAGKLTKRNSVMFGVPGHAYVYFCYGCHFMFNTVTEKKGKAGAVLIRAVESDGRVPRANGPGKLAKYLRIGRAFNEHDLASGKKLYIADDGYAPGKIGRSGRIGISGAREKLLRFFIKENPHVSKYR